MAGVGWSQCLKENMTMEQPVQTGGAETAGKIEKGSEIHQVGFMRFIKIQQGVYNI